MDYSIVAKQLAPLLANQLAGVQLFKITKNDKLENLKDYFSDYYLRTNEFARLLASTAA